MPWELLAERLCASQESSDSQTAVADAIAQGSQSDGAEVEEPPAHLWWVELLKDHTKELGIPVPSRSTPIKIVSACSGCCAEATVCKDCRVRWFEVFRALLRAYHISIVSNHNGQS